MEHTVYQPTQSWRPKFRQRFQLLVPAYIGSLSLSDNKNK